LLTRVPLLSQVGFHGRGDAGGGGVTLAHVRTLAESTRIPPQTTTSSARLALCSAAGTLFNTVNLCLLAVLHVCIVVHVTNGLVTT
jgi:hypothetical protein